MTKEELRGQMRAMRAELTGDKRDAAERQAADHMMAFLRQKRPRRFYPFVSCRTEIDTLQLLQRVWKELKCIEIAVAVPRVEGNRMHFYEVRAMNDLHRGAMGILEPAGAEPVRAEDGVMLVPGLAYDERGYRVGYGATLRNMDCVNRMPEEYSRLVMHFRFNLCSGWKHRSMMLHWMRL